MERPFFPPDYIYSYIRGKSWGEREEGFGIQELQPTMMKLHRALLPAFPHHRGWANTTFYFIVYCVVIVLVTQSCLILCDPMDCSLPGSVYGVFQARTLEWAAISFSPGDLLDPRIKSQVSCIAGRFFTIWTTRKAPVYFTWAFNFFLFWLLTEA